MADVLPQPPFDFEKEPLVTSSVELGTERLAGGFSWLVNCIQEQHRLLGSICDRVDGLEAGGASGSGRPAAPQSLQSSMREEMLSMQLNTLRHEVASLPRPGDLDRQRERLMAEVTSLSGGLSDRQRESDDRVQKELASVTDSLCKQLERISTEVSSRLTNLEEQLASVADQAPAAGAGSQSRAISPPGEAPLGSALGGVALPQAVPLSPSQQAEDTEDQTEPLSPSAAPASQAAPAPYDGPSRADLADLDSRIDSRIATLERQITNLSARQAEVSQQLPPADSVGQAVPDLADRVPAAGTGVPATTAADMAAMASEAVAAARAADAKVLDQLRCTMGELSTQVQEIKAEHVRDVEALRSQVQEASSRQTATDAFALPMASPAAGTDATSQVAAVAAPTSQAPTPGVSPEELVAIQAMVQEQLGQIQGRLQSVEASLGAVESTLPEFKKAVPELEASLRKVEEALSRVSEIPTALQEGSAPHVAASVVDAAPSAPAAEEESVAKAAPPSPTAPAASAGMLGRLQALEEWRAKVESKLSRPTGVALSSVAEFDEGEEENQLLDEVEGEEREEDSQPESEAEGASTHKRAATAPAATSNATAMAVADAPETQHGPPGGRWKDVQAELERFRKLFEFVEGVLPEDAAEAMRFFNRRKQSASSLSDHVSQILGPEVDFLGHKTKLEQEFKKTTTAMRDEFENLSLAMKGLQRDVETSGGKIQDLSKRMRQFEGDCVRGQPLASPYQSLQASGPYVTSEEQPFQEPSPRPSEKQDEAKEELALDYVSKNVHAQGLEELREEVRRWLELLRSSTLSALQTKADSEQLDEFAKQMMLMQNGENLALFAKRQLVGKCASCEAPIEADMLRVKRPQAVGLQKPWPVHGVSLGAQVNIRQPTGANGQSGMVSSQRLPKIQKDSRSGKVLKASASSPDMRKDSDA